MASRTLSLFLAALISAPALAQPEPDVPLACKALACLAYDRQDGVCEAPTAAYFAIKADSEDATTNARAQMLATCKLPEPHGPSLIAVIARAAGRCTAEALNARNPPPTEWPDYCAVMYAHPQVRFVPPLYLSTPNGGGKWIPGK